MKNGIKGFAAGILVCVMLIGVVFASNAQVREIFFGVQVSVNGEAQTFDDDMQPFIMDGRTFLPVRGIADVLGVDVDFDAGANMVLLNSGISNAQRRPLWQAVPPTYGNNIVLRDAIMLEVTYPNSLFEQGWSDHHLAGQFTTLTGTIGRLDGSARTNGIVTFTGDGNQLVSFEINERFVPRDFSIDVSGISVLRIEIHLGGGTSPVFTNMMIE